MNNCLYFVPALCTLFFSMSECFAAKAISATENADADKSRAQDKVKIDSAKANDVPLTDENRKYYPNITTQKLFSKNDKRYTDGQIKNYEILYPVTYIEFSQEDQQKTKCFNVKFTKEDMGKLIFEKEYVKAKKLTPKSYDSFYLCDIVLPKEITTIEKESFSSDGDYYSTFFNGYLKEYDFGRLILNSIIIPEGVSKIGEKAFCNCTSLEKINIPKNVSELGNSCFASCTTLKEVNIEGNNVTLGDECFKKCPISQDNVNAILKKTTKLGKECFAENTDIKEITIPSNITYIPDGCFKNCTNLTTIIKEGENITFGKDCFSGCRALKNKENI